MRLSKMVQATEVLHLGPGKVDQQPTRVLQQSKLVAKSRGDLQSACISAGYYAKKMNKTMYVYSGNSYGHLVWRVSYKTEDYLNPINNTGTRVLSVTPNLTVSWHDVLRRE
jgi:hypothetical protein